MQQTNEKSTGRTAILLLTCALQKKVNSYITDFIYAHDGKIVYHDQYADAGEGLFFTRIEWDLSRFTIPDDEMLARLNDALPDDFKSQRKLFFSDQRPRMAIFVSRYSHCLYDLLARYQSGEWAVEIPLIISNHPDMEDVAKTFGIDYHLVPITKETKKEQERKQLRLLEEYNIDFIVLARYMQILSADFVKHYPQRIINIHHSFLPAFPGGRPYNQAFDRGVKLIGATSHFVTAELDDGPIIDQEVVRVSHRHTVDDLKRMGCELEKLVLARAVWAQLQHKIIVYGKRSVVFI